MAGEIRKYYEFGGFRFDAQTHCLQAGDELVPLPPKSLETLGILLEHRGEVVTREALLDAVWEESYVDDANLTVAISTLRKTLAEFEGGGAYIQTISRKGYRFTAQVEERIEVRDKPIVVTRQTREEMTVTADDGQLSSAHRARFLRPILLVIALVAIAIGGLFAYRSWWLKPVPIGEIKTIAILPFEDLSEQQTEKYLGVSLPDALARQLGGLGRITVRPIGSVLKYAERHNDVQAVGRELQVDAVLDGRIQRVGERLRVSVQLIRTSDNTTVWTQDFDDTFANFFAVQDQISREVAGSLAVQMNGDERRQFDKHGTTNVDAYEAYMRGRYLWNKRTPDSLKKGIEEFDQAARSDPNFALAYAGLADCYQLLAEYGVTSPDEAFPKAREAAKKALELDADLAEAHTALAYTLAFYDWDWANAERSFKRALELNPNYATAHQWYGEYLAVRGRFGESRPQFDRALQIDPVSPILMTEIAALYYVQGDYDHSIEQSKKIIDLDPNFAYAYYYLATGYVHKGMEREYVEAFDQMLSLFGEPADCLEELKQAFARDGREGYWKKRIEQIQTRPHLKNMPAFNRAFVYIQVGDKEAALDQLERSYQRRERLIINSRYTPDFESLREDPRFQALQLKLGL